MQSATNRAAATRSWRSLSKATNLLVPDHGGLHSSPERQRQRRARTLRPTSPCTMRQPQACSASRSVLMGRSLCSGQTLAGACFGVPAAETSTHLASASASYCGPARKLCRPVGGIMMAAHFATANELQVPDRGGLHSSPECQRQRGVCTLRLPSPRTIDQAASLLDQSEHHDGGSLCNGQTHAGAWFGVPVAETSTHLEHARTLRPPPFHTVDQPQACSTSCSFMMAAHFATAKHVQVAGSECRRQRRARTLSTHAPCVRLRLVLWTSHTLARPVAAS